MNDTYKIISLEANNIKVLKAIRITPEKNVVTLTGENGAGKSSVLDAITYALGGAEEICERPIRDGATSAKVVCTLNGLIVTRKFGPTGTSLTVTNDEGVPQKTPQAILDTLIGNLSFDPLSFARMKPAEQLSTLRKLVGLDFSALDQKRSNLYQDRTIANREHDSARARLFATQHYPDAPAEEVSIAELQKEIEAIAAHNQSNQQQVNELRPKETAWHSARDLVNAKRERVREIEAQIETLKQTLVQNQNLLLEAETHAANLKQVYESYRDQIATLEDKDSTPLKLRISQAEEINRQVRSNRDRKIIEESVKAKKTESDRLTKEIEDIDRDKQSQLSKAKFPLPNLSFDDGNVLLDGKLFSQASDGEKLRVSVAVGMALNPKLRVIFIRDGSLLDKDGLKTIAELAEKNNYQVWLEDARSTDPTALVIEDGEIKS